MSVSVIVLSVFCVRGRSLVNFCRGYCLSPQTPHLREYALLKSTFVLVKQRVVMLHVGICDGVVTLLHTRHS
jgi:hypothetical protein